MTMLALFIYYLRCQCQWFCIYYGLFGQVIAIKDILPPSNRRKFDDVYVVYELMDSDLLRVVESKQSLTEGHCQVSHALTFCWSESQYSRITTHLINKYIGTSLLLSLWTYEIIACMNLLIVFSLPNSERVEVYPLGQCSA